jgi:hypothetical protein
MWREVTFLPEIATTILGLTFKNTRLATFLSRVDIDRTFGGLTF